MKVKSFIICALVALLGVTASCGGSKHEASSEQAGQQQNALYEAMRSGDIAQVEIVADSLSELFDELNTDEQVTLLLAYLQVHNDAAAKKDTKHDLETIRKFMDIYELSMASNGDEITRAFNAARDLNGNVDLPVIASTFREQLADYDAVAGELKPEPTPAPAPVDETKPAPQPAQPKAEQPAPDAAKSEPKQEVTPAED